MQKIDHPKLQAGLALAMVLGSLGGAIVGSFLGYSTLHSTPAIPTPLSDSELRIEVIHKVSPAVVTITNQMLPLDNEAPYNTEFPLVSGSGVIVDSRGYIITNKHVVARADKLRVTFTDGSKAVATVVGLDSVYDLAIIKVDVPVPASVELGDSSKLLPGQMVIAIGSPFDTFPGTATMGIVSALNRRFGGQSGLIQTDAPINMGDSGGPLVNMQGQLIGINTLVVRHGNDGRTAEGLGFAIPSNAVSDLVARSSDGSLAHSQGQKFCDSDHPAPRTGTENQIGAGDATDSIDAELKTQRRTCD